MQERGQFSIDAPVFVEFDLASGAIMGAWIGDVYETDEDALEPTDDLGQPLDDEATARVHELIRELDWTRVYRLLGRDV